MVAMSNILTSKNMTRLRKGDLVRHSGMLCIFRGLLKKKTWVRLLCPNDKIIAVSKREIVRKERARAAALTEFKTAIRREPEDWNFIYPTTSNTRRSTTST